MFIYWGFVYCSYNRGPEGPVSCPTRRSLYWYLGFCNDHLNTQITERQQWTREGPTLVSRKWMGSSVCRGLGGSSLVVQTCWFGSHRGRHSGVALISFRPSSPVLLVFTQFPKPTKYASIHLNTFSDKHRIWDLSAKMYIYVENGKKWKV